MNLLNQLHDLRQQVRRLLWLTGLSWVMAGLLVGLLAIGVGDWLWHFDDRGQRIGLLLLLTGVVGWVTWRKLVSPLRSPLSNVELSGHLERCFPSLRGRLATAVEFLERDVSPAVGSPELQRRLIEQTSADVRSLDFADVLDRRETKRATLALAGLCGVTLLLTVANASAAATAIQRLLLSDQRWPKSVELQLVKGDLSPVQFSETEPLRSLQGQPLDLFVINRRGTLPQPVWVEFRRGGRRPQTETLRLATLRDASDAAWESAALRLPVDEGLVEFRAIGGDDFEMSWHTLWITPPPKLESFHVQVIPPSYTGEGSTTLAEGATQVRAVVGSRLQITARASRPIEAATWDAGPFSVSPNGRDLKSELTVLRAGSTTHQLSLTDRDRFENRSALRLEVVGTADPPPSVTLAEPATDQLVTPNATVRIAATVRDDRKLREIGLEYLVVRTTTSELPDADVPASKEAEWQNENLPHEGASREATVRREWLLSDLNLAVGDRVALRIVASDHCDVGASRVGRSATRTLTVVTSEAKLQEIAQRLDLLLRELESLAARQAQTKDQTEELRVQVEKTGELRTQDRDTLKRVEMDQRQIGSRLIASSPAERGDDVTALARELLAQLEANQLHDSATRERLLRIATGIEALGQEALPTLQSTLGKIVKESLGGPPTPNLSRPFADVVARQDEVLSTLTELVRDLTQWRDRRELAREVAELAATQEVLNRDTLELAPQTLGKTTSQLPNQQQADVAKLADRQSRQAERIEQLRQRIAGQSSEQLGRSPQDQVGQVDTLPHEDVVREFDERGLIAKAHEAAQDVAANNLGQASRTQQQLADELKSLAANLAQTPSTKSDGAAREFQELAEQLQSLTQQQRRLLDESRAAAAKAESLTPEQLTERANGLREQQEQTTKAADQLASRLKQSSAAEASSALRRARRHMQQAESQLGDQQFARGADEQQTALEDLEQSGRELAAARRSARQEQLAEQAQELAQLVREMAARQSTVVDQTRLLAEAQQQAGKWTRPLARSALVLAETEQLLADGTKQLADILSDVKAIQLTIARIQLDLSAAATRLRNKQLDEETQRREQSALRLLQSLAEALAPESTPPSPDEQNAQPPADRNKNLEPVSPLAMLKLLRQIQAGVGELTQAAESRLPTTPPNDDHAARRATEVGQIAEAQQAVRDATSELLEQVPAAPAPAEDEEAPRESALAAMQRSFEFLQDRETGKPTQAVQQTAVASLDTLLKLWQQRAARQPSLARSGQTAPMPDKPTGDPSTTGDGSGGKPTGRDAAQARTSSDRERTGTDTEGDLRRQRQLREAVWGHLPPALREKMLNLPHDKTLPKYSEQIRRYYEALAEQN